MIDLSEQPAALAPGDIVILASDGINTLEVDAIARIIGASAAEGASAVALRLLANVEDARQPHQDNTTIVAIRVFAADV